MILTNKQQKGLDIAVNRYLRKEKYTIISGYAGTGKSTLIKFIIAALPDIDENDVVFTSFTGKATEVLSKKGNKNTCTLHKLLYKSVPRPDGTFFRMPVETIPYKIVVVDEISMVPKTLINQLAKYDIYVLGLGDPFQLPPIDKNEDNHLLEYPHVFLDEIMRQAADSEIIQLTMKIRNGEKITPFKGKEVQVLSKNEINTGMFIWADQILVATNAMRNQINTEMRTLLGREGGPQDGDKIICCRNYWDDMGTEGGFLVNGTIGYLKDIYPSFVPIPSFTGYKNNSIDVICGNIVTDTEEEFHNLKMDKLMITHGEKSLDSKTQYILGRNPKYHHLIPYEFLYGYAITCHKAQGSEWGKVLVIEEKFPFNKEEHARWLYTACTRASEKLVLILAD